MASLGFNFNLSGAMAALSHWLRSQNVEGVEERWEAGAASLEARVAATFGSHQPTIPVMVRRVNFFKITNIDSLITSFFSAKEIATTIKHINKQVNEASKAAIRIQLAEKKSLTWEEMVDYQHLLGLADPAEVLHPDIDDTLLGRLLARLPSLTSLDLSWCTQLTVEGLKVSLALCPNLTSLDLSWCENLTDEGPKASIALCPNLTSLKLSGCIQLTDEGLKAIIVLCPNLTSLDLSCCRQLTDEGLHAIVALCPNLTSLDLSGCRWLTDEGLEAIVALGPNLTSLNLSCCRQLTDEELKASIALCPNLTSLKL